MVTPLISVNTLYSVGARCAIGEAEPVAKHLRLSPRQHDLWVLAHVADRDDDERREGADDGLRGAGEQHRPDGGGLDRLHHQQGGRGDEAGGDGVVAGHVHLGEVLQNRNPHDDLPALHRVGQQKAGYRGAGEGAQDTLDGAVVLCTFRFRDYEKPCKYPP